ncbi:hypothetical protein [Acidipila sp. EB88]|nr:hypothetical protein [Acidipila sp. EB88]
MSMPYTTLRRKDAVERKALREQAEACVQMLARAQYTPPTS